MILALSLPWFVVVVLGVAVLTQRARRRWHGPRLVKPKPKRRSGSRFWNDPSC